MNKQDPNTTTAPATTATEDTGTQPAEAFTVEAHPADDLQVQAFERGPLTDLNFGF